MAKPTWPRSAAIFEVGPRDGLQAENVVLSVEQRRELVQKLLVAGLRDIEVGSFVRADRIPQLQGTEELLKSLQAQKPKDARFWAFVPNQVGLENALQARVDGGSFFVAASDTFCKKNVNRSRQDQLTALGDLYKTARKHKLATRTYLSTLVYCPYEGPTAPELVFKVIKQLVDAGAQEIVLSDTTGHANPRQLARLLDKILAKFPAKRFALHIHDTRGLALAVCLEGLHYGITRFDASVGGLGGCPYAPGASGNLATEDLANMLLGQGLLNGVDLGRIGQTSQWIEGLLGRQLPSRVLRTLEKKL